LAVAELARDTGLTSDRVLDALEAPSARRPSSLDSPLDRGRDTNATLAEFVPGDDDGYDKVVDLTSLAPLIERLSPRDRRLISMRFGDELTQREIGQRLGVSQMQVSRLLRRVLDTLELGLAGVWGESTKPAP